MELRAAFTVPAGTTFVLVGESGAGKTTLLRLLAGLGRPDSGRISLEGVILFDGAERIDVPAWRRPVGYVPQDYALFPHLTVFENVAFGLRAGGLDARAVRPRVTAALERFDLVSLAGRRPAQLSGGQQQRAAIARALVLEPRLLLLDEPLSALDLQTRRAVRGELRHLLADLTCVTLYVTHSPVEALIFGDLIGVVERGRMDQVGSREELLRRPRSGYVAELMGVNLFRGMLVERFPDGLARLRTVEGDLHVMDPGGEGEVLAAVAPRDIGLYLDPPRGSAQNVFPGRVVELIPEPAGAERVRVVVATRPPLVAEVSRHAVDALGLREGMLVHASFKATAVSAYR